MERKRCSNQEKNGNKKAGTREKEIDGQIDKTRKKVEESQSICKSDKVQCRKDEDNPGKDWKKKKREGTEIS